MDKNKIINSILIVLIIINCVFSIKNHKELNNLQAIEVVISNVMVYLFVRLFMI